MKIKSNSADSERKFIDNIKKFFEDPLVILPECTDSCMFCPVKSYKKKIEAMMQNKNFGKYFNSADQLLSAISESYKILENERVPLTGIIKTNYGSVSFCKRGNSDEYILSGVQNYNNTVYRLLAFKNVIKNKKLNIYSSSNFFQATCKNMINIETLKDILNDEKLQYKIENGDVIFGTSGNKMEFNLFNIKIIIYEDFQQNIPYLLFKHIAMYDYNLDIKTDFLEFIDDDKGTVFEYINNNMDGRTFFSKIKKFKINYVKNNALFVIDNKNYGVEDFVKILNFDPKISDFIKDKLRESKTGFYLENANQRKIFEFLFPRYKNEIIKLMYGLNDDEIKKLKGGPLEIMNMAADIKNRKNVENKIVKPWSENSGFLIGLITEYFSHGEEAGIVYGQRGSVDSPIKKGIYSAFLSVLGKNEGWRFSDSEEKLGELIYPYMKNIINGTEINKELNKLKAIID
ncbi:hypothetical protein [Acidiplasma sp.]|uniref:hypothetical protein n=1 Tax=Acidiplasma sp. TaxID=1872114 RepID=UPI002588EA85|nr:hypothetical protein [Acidiplasma sp.]